MKQLSIMADYGMGPYAWLNENPVEDPRLGPNIADMTSGFPEEWNGSKELEADFAEWMTQFERDSWDHFDSFPWEEFHRRGIELSRRLKLELGSEFWVRYVKAMEDPNFDVNRAVEIELDAEGNPVVRRYTPPGAGAEQLDTTGDSMIIGIEFIGDNDEGLKSIQGEMYADLLPYLFIEARRVYLRAEEILYMQTNLGRKVHPLHSNTTNIYRALQEAHDITAARFRFERPELRQFSIPFLPVDPVQALRDEWRCFFEGEAKRLAQFADFTRAVLTAVVYPSVAAAQPVQGPELGSQAQDLVEQILLAEYRALFDSDLVTGSRWKKIQQWPELPGWLTEVYSI